MTDERASQNCFEYHDPQEKPCSGRTKTLPKPYHLHNIFIQAPRQTAALKQPQVESFYENLYRFIRVRTEAGAVRPPHSTHSFDLYADYVLRGMSSDPHVAELNNNCLA